MNWIDRSIAVISPRWAYKRMAWRSGMSVFDAGDRGRNNHGWNPASSPNEQRKQQERALIRARAQDLEHNSDIAGGILQAFERNVTGTGIMLQAKIPADHPGNAGGELNREIEELWKEYCKAENVDVTGAQSLEEISEMLIRRYIVDGGVFVVKVYVKGDKFPFKLQIRSVDELNTLVVPGEGKRIVEGVELDDLNRPAAYHFKKGDGYLFNPAETVRIPAKDVIFLYKKTHPQQVREVSQLVTALPRIKDANQFIEAVSIKERVLACMSVFIKKATPSGSLGRGVKTGGETIDYSGVSLAPGMIGELNPGDEVQTVIPTGQASNTKEFIVTLVRMIAAGLGLSYEAVSRDLSQVNYSSARQGLIEDRKLYKKLQKMLIDRVLRPVYLEFLDSVYLSGQLDLPKYGVDKKPYLAHVWVPPGSTWIDPQKEANANKTALESNQDTLARICAERGEDWRDVIEQRAAEINLINDLIGQTAGKESEGIAEEEVPADDEEKGPTDDAA
ncbi:phage portal protein, lambda family [Paenibacillus sophorae]|uniref:Phage portal protein, lambda family n=1 Tax=Paenibacillus sophorae TaxID=1333845 RepID=A0A1H8VSE2_9BACL|nr:phage portal protein, lambda family [Paenibacillus sophorae]